MPASATTLAPFPYDEGDEAYLATGPTTPRPGPEPTEWFCTAPVLWPDPENLIRNPTRSNTCWTSCPSPEAREEHTRTAHPEWVAALNEPRNPVSRAGLGIVEDAPPARGTGSPTGAPSPNGPTDKQVDLLKSLARRKGVEVPEVRTKKAASREIDRLMALPDLAIRSNRHAAPCSECGGRVEAEAGVLRQDPVTGRWIVGHLSCPIDAPEAAPKVPDGRYAVLADAGHWSFYKVTNGRKPGILFMDLLIGGGEDGTFVSQTVPDRQRPAILAKIAADPEAAGLAFGREAQRCRRCGRGLTLEQSRTRGVGPECYRKGDAAD